MKNKMTIRTLRLVSFLLERLLDINPSLLFIGYSSFFYNIFSSISPSQCRCSWRRQDVFTIASYHLRTAPVLQVFSSMVNKSHINETASTSQLSTTDQVASANDTSLISPRGLRSVFEVQHPALTSTFLTFSYFFRRHKFQNINVEEKSKSKVFCSIEVVENEWYLHQPFSLFRYFIIKIILIEIFMKSIKRNQNFI